VVSLKSRQCDCNDNSIDVLEVRPAREDLLTKYRKDAQALYSNFAPTSERKMQVCTVRDLANPYIQMMADTFEDVADNIKLTARYNSKSNQ